MALLEIKDIKKSFGEKTILNGISFSVNRGEVVVLVGPSGCGKSTTLRCINGLEEIDSGKIFLDGNLISESKKQMHLVRQKIGMVFQSYDLFPHKTVLGNLLLGPMKAQGRKKEEAAEEAKKLLERVGLLDKINSYPRELSGGQKQRVAIARALIMHPEILLFDEVTAALDPEMVREVLDVMAGLAASGITMVIVTHQMEFARAIADHVIFMEDGKIVEKDEGDQFFVHPQTERAKAFLNTFSFEEIRQNRVQMSSGL